MDVTIPVAIAFVSGLLVLSRRAERWLYERAERMLLQWTEQHQLTLVAKERANPLGSGPMMRSRTQQVMFRVTVRDVSGRERSGVVTIGSWMEGVLDRRLAVIWEDGSEQKFILPP